MTSCAVEHDEQLAAQRAAWRDRLVPRWAESLVTTAYVPLDYEEIQQRLRVLVELLDRVVGAPAETDGTEADVATVGAELVRTHFIGRDSLRNTVELLGGALLTHPVLRRQEQVPERVVSLLGTIATGYADALRHRALDQQEYVKRALLKAKRDVERILQVSEARFREVFTTSTVGIVISDLNGKLVQCNRALLEILGYEKEQLEGHSLVDLFHPEEVRDLENLYRQLVLGFADRFRESRRLLREDGETVWAHLGAALLRDVDGAPLYHVTTVEDITELHLLQKRLRHQTLHDALTGLPNRQYLVSHLERVLGGTDTPDITLLLLDLDGFTVVSEGLGPEVADRLLQVVARRLEAVVDGERAMVARLGGDEFAVLIENSADTPDASALVAAVNGELTEPTWVDGRGIATSASIGVVQHVPRGVTPVELLRCAGATLRRAKASGKRQWALYDPAVDARERRERALAAQMPGALENGDLDLRYQSVVRLADRQVVGIDVQLVWECSEHGVLDHDHCVELAAATGLDLPLGTWALETACRLLRGRERENGSPGQLLTFRLTPLQAGDPDLVATVHDVLHRTGLPAERLQLLFPVEVLRDENSEAWEGAQLLAEAGVHVALHGFRGGFTDLSVLEGLHVRLVSLAPDLVRRVGSAEGNSTLLERATRELVDLVHQDGATVHVARVDAAEQAIRWRDLGVDLAQGDFFTAPVPVPR